jgi:hypothetical protein
VAAESEWQPRDSVAEFTDTIQGSYAFTFGDESFGFTDSTVVTGTHTTVRAEDGSESHQWIFTRITTQNDNGDAISYTAEGEIRIVDGVIYGKATYLTSSGDVPSLPEDWVIITTSDDYDVFDTIPLENFIEDEEDNDDSWEEFGPFLNTDVDPEFTISQEENSLDDGTPIDLITVVGGEAAFMESFQLDMDEAAADGEESDPFDTLFATALSDDSYIRLEYGIGAKGELLYRTFDSRFMVVEADMAALSEDYQIGSLFSIDLQSITQRIVVSFDTGLAPIEPPALPQ